MNVSRMMLTPTSDDGFRQFPVEYDGPVMATNEDCNEEVNFITTKLRRLRDRRIQMMERWSTSRGDEGLNCHVGEPPPDPVKVDQLDDHDSPGPMDNGILENPSADRKHDYETCSDYGKKQIQGVNGCIDRLRQELASLFSQDNAIFEQLLALRQSIAQLKQQSYDDIYEDAEVMYLSSGGGGSFRYRPGGSMRRATVDAYSCFTPLEQNYEDSGISLESSGLSSPSMSPSPTVATGAALPSAQCSRSLEPDLGFHGNSVTFPPSRNRQSRSHGVSELAKNKQNFGSSPNGVHALGDCGVLERRTRPTSSRRKSQQFPGTPPVVLVRSRSITFLPRGVLVRKENSGDSSQGNGPSDGEVFV